MTISNLSRAFSPADRLAVPRIDGPAAPGGSAADAPAGASSFADTLARALDSVNALQLNGQEKARALADGSATNIHDVTIALEQANIALQLTATVRNRAVEAYQEVMRMGV